MPIYRAKRGVINTKCCVKFNFLNTEGGKKKDELIDGLTSAAYRPTSPRKEFVTREKFEANYKKVSRKAKVSSERTFHRAGITREERKPVNNDFSGGVDVPEKRTAYAFTNFFEDTEDTPPPPRKNIPETAVIPLESTGIIRLDFTRSISRFTVNNQKQQREILIDSNGRKPSSTLSLSLCVLGGRELHRSLYPLYSKLNLVYTPPLEWIMRVSGYDQFSSNGPCETRVNARIWIPSD